MRNSSLLALTVTVDDRQNLSMRMALAAERRIPDLGLMEPLGWHWGLFVLADMQQVGTRCPILPHADVTATKPSYTVPYLDLFLLFKPKKI